MRAIYFDEYADLISWLTQPGFTHFGSFAEFVQVKKSSTPKSNWWFSTDTSSSFNGGGTPRLM